MSERTGDPASDGELAQGIIRLVAGRGERPEAPSVAWTFITTHGLVLLAIVQAPDIRLRDIATQVGITERAVQRIVTDLIDAGYLTRTRVGRRNLYQVHGNVHMPHATTRHQPVGALMALLTTMPQAGKD